MTIGEDDVILRAYVRATDAAARLYCFGMTPKDHFTGPIYLTAIELAADDLRTFALNVRALAENTGVKGDLSQIILPGYEGENGVSDAIGFLRVINVSIHHRGAWFFHFGPETKKFSPRGARCIVTSDKGKTYGVYLGEFIQVFQENVLPIISTACSEVGLILPCHRFFERTASVEAAPSDSPPSLP